MTTTWKVAVEAPLPKLLTYSTNHELGPGRSVDVPLGKRFIKGVVIEPDPAPSTKFALKEIAALDGERPLLTPQHLEWALWISKYYHYPPGDVFSMFFPPLVKTGRGKPKDIFTEAPVAKDIRLTPEQDEIFRNINDEKDFSAHLLWGITGSGKTEVYIELIKSQMARGRGAIVLLPEIALTPQLVSRFRNRLGDVIAVLHSGLTERERTNQWWSLIEGRKKVLIGARSALFCPMPDLGIIIVDEEHETSYKQDESLRYNARDAAVMRACYEKIPVVLGSATPSLESWKNVEDKKYKLHRLTARAASGLMPDIKVIDLSEQDKQNKRPDTPFWLSEELRAAIEENYTRGLQTALFLNRRGIAQTVLCPGCGFVYKCPNCEISLTLHGQNHLVCHYCQYTDKMSGDCPDCKDDKIKPIGLGTEQVEDDLRKLFPHARVARVDRDEIDSRELMEDFVKKMENREVDILVGTQMIAKGLDFENLTLVGIVMADLAFNIPDFRSAERSYQLLTQVGGRSGRHLKGHVIIQTYRPDHPSILFTQNNDTEGFLRHELEQRQELSYPPYTRMACVKISGLSYDLVRQSALELTLLLKGFCEDKKLTGLRILGPAPAPLLKIRNRYRFQVLIKSTATKEIHGLLQFVSHVEDRFKRVKVQIDMDPYNLM